jgi:hypothetical protein
VSLRSPPLDALRDYDEFGLLSENSRLMKTVFSSISDEHVVFSE